MHINGAAMRIYFPYFIAYGSTELVEPIICINPLISIRPAVDISIPHKNDAASPELPYISASSVFEAPSLLLIILPHPIPIPKPIAWITAIIENTIPTAAEASVFILATKYVSAVL